MNSPPLANVLFPALFGMVVVGLALTKLLHTRFERLHPKKYEAMGRPSLFLRNNISTSWATQKFIFAREHKSMKDSQLSKLSDSLLVFQLVYLVVFIALVFSELPPR